MMKLTRREALQGVSAISLAAAAGSLISCGKTQEPRNTNSPQSPLAVITDSSPRVNIVVHGMTAMIFDVPAQKVFLKAPKVPHHVYGAGKWNEEMALMEGAVYKLSGVSLSKPIDLKNYAALPWVDWKNSGITGYKNPPFCAFELPFPEDIWPLRPLPRGATSLFTGNTAMSNKLDQTAALPLVYVLTYTNFTGTPSLADPNDPLHPVWVGDAGATNHVHVFGEPAFAVADPHLKDAMIALNGLFDPIQDLALADYVQSVSSLPADVNTGHSSVAPREEWGLLNERMGSDSKGGAPRNCMSLPVSKTT
jgi:hypothetical protein